MREWRSARRSCPRSPDGLGLWTGHLNPDNFARFIERTAELNPFMPAPAMPLLAWAATLVETTFGVALIAGIRLRWTAFGSAVLLAWFGTAMALTAGLKSPLDYSVFSGSAAALLLALHESGARVHAPSQHRSARNTLQKRLPETAQ